MNPVGGLDGNVKRRMVHDSTFSAARNEGGNAWHSRERTQGASERRGRVRNGVGK